MNYYYNPSESSIYSSTWVSIYGGIDPSTSTPGELAAAGYYLYVPAQIPPYDSNLQQLVSEITIGGTDAVQSYTVSDLPLETAQANAVSYEKQQTALKTAAICEESGYCEDILTATASKAEIDRDPTIQATLTAQNQYVDRMVANISAINAATSIEDISNVIYAPIGVLSAGRGGPGQLGPEDLNPSYLVSLSLSGYSASELELFVPGTGTVISYDGGLPSPYEFDSSGDCFAVDDYVLQVRVAATGFVLGTLTVPEGANTDVGFS